MTGRKRRIEQSTHLHVEEGGPIVQAGPIQPGSLQGGLKKGAEEGPDLGRGGGGQGRKLNTEE